MPGRDLHKIQFHFNDVKFTLPERQKLKAFILQLLKNEGLKTEHINFVFCNDAYLLQINQTYLRHNTLTDIVTFPLSAPGAPLLADIYISIDRIRENARTYATGFQQELHRVIFHGILHLCGYKDKTGKDSKLMRQKEDCHLQKYFVSRGT